MGSLALRPGDSLTILTMALSASFIRFVSSTGCDSSYGALTFTPVGLSPTEHTSLRWTHVSIIITVVSLRKHPLLKAAAFSPIAHCFT